MFELLNSWQSYVDVIYMSESEAAIILALESEDIRPDELSYQSKHQEAEVGKRLNTLFGKDPQPEEKATDESAI